MRWVSQGLNPSYGLKYFREIAVMKWSVALSARCPGLEPGSIRRGGYG